MSKEPKPVATCASCGHTFADHIWQGEEATLGKCRVPGGCRIGCMTWIVVTKPKRKGTKDV